ncbi:MAG: S8 family peptidase [Gemmatimonadota bacterium]
MKYRRALPALPLIVALLVGVLVPSTLPSQGVANPLRDAVIRSGGRVIVTLRSTQPGNFIRLPGSPPVTGTELAAIATRIGASYRLRETGRAPFAGMIMGEISADEAVALAADPNVELVEADRLWAPTDLGDDFDPSDRWAAYRVRVDDVPYGVTNVTAPAVWATGNRGEGVKVAAMDSGGDASHPDLNYVGGYNAVTRTTSGWADDIGACNGHGTHVAGTIAALDNGSGVVGIAPRSQLYAIKVFENVSGSCLAYTSSQINGLQWAVTQGIRLVNVSIGGSYSPSYDAAIQTAAASGTYLIAASGNNGGAVLFPGSSAYSIAVAAVDGNNNRASWSDYGPEVDFSAPGVSINSTMPGGGYGYKSGTSMATPHVVGVSALILSAFPSLSFSQLYQKLRDGALDLESGGFDNNTGYGLVRASNSIGGALPPPVPLTLAVSPAARSASVQQGSSAPSDQATVTLSGDNNLTTAWTATKRKSWTTLTTSSGIGSGTVAWNRNATGLAVGTYIDTITVTAVGVATPRTVFDTLRVTAVPVPLTLAVSPAARSATVQAGGSAPADQATVTLSGDNNATTPWSATKRKSWTTLTTGSGTGSGTVAWSRNATGLAAGTYVDTITVTAVGVATPRTVFDTLRVTAAPVPLTLAVSPSARSVTVQAGTSAPADQATVTLSGDNNATTPWSATKRKSWTTLTTGSGTGSGTLAWSRNASGLAAGVYVDTITVTATGVATPRTVYDTLRITTAPVPLTLAVSPSARSVTVQAGSSAPSDQATVTLSGDNNASTPWSATKRKSWTTLTTGSGTGSGTVAWSRNTSGLAAGVYVDTITVTATGVATPRTVYDTLRITTAPVPLTLAVSPAARSVSVQAGNSAPADQATVTLSGDNNASTSWSATKRKSWTTLTTGSGTGSGTVSWSRDASGLAAGTYVDTITVTAAGVATPGVVYDTLRITAAPDPLTIALDATSRNVSVVQGGAAPSDQVIVWQNGTGHGTSVWTATKRKPWTTLTSASGSGGGATLAWSRSAAGLAVGTYVDTITVSASGALGSPAMLIDTLRVTASVTPVTLAVAPASRNVSVEQGSVAPSDQAAVTLSGDNSSSVAWNATKRKSWTTLTTASGTGSGTVAWSRNAAGLAVGTYVDTITIAATGVIGTRTLVDTLRITSAPVIPITVAVSPTGRRASVGFGGSAPSDSLAVTLSGTGSSTTSWQATSSATWATLRAGGGTGNGWLRWDRDASALSEGTYVATIQVRSGASSAVLFDTLIVLPAPKSIAVTPRGKKFRLLTSASSGASIAGALDSAIVQGNAPVGGSNEWTAATTASRLRLVTESGSLNGAVVWERLSTTLAVGLHVDSIEIRLQADASVRSVFVDTLEVVSVPAPEPGLAVEELFRAGGLTADQRAVLDREGNGNGAYDLGDLLAWIDRSHVRLSAQVAAQLQGLMLREAAPAPKAAGVVRDR